MSGIFELAEGKRYEFRDEFFLNIVYFAHLYISLQQCVTKFGEISSKERMEGSNRFTDKRTSKNIRNVRQVLEQTPCI